MKMITCILCGRHRVSLPIQCLLSWYPAKSIREISRLSQSEGMVGKLLEGMHDAVVHLNSDLKITRPIASLGGLLMQAKPDGQRLLHTGFLDAVHESDHQKVLEAFGQAVHQDEVSVRVMVLLLRDANSTKFAVEGLGLSSLESTSALSWASVRSASKLQQMPGRDVLVDLGPSTPFEQLSLILPCALAGTDRSKEAAYGPSFVDTHYCAPPIPSGTEP